MGEDRQLTDLNLAVEISSSDHMLVHLALEFPEISLILPLLWLRFFYSGEIWEYTRSPKFLYWIKLLVPSDKPNMQFQILAPRDSHHKMEMYVQPCQSSFLNTVTVRLLLESSV